MPTGMSIPVPPGPSGEPDTSLPVALHSTGTSAANPGRKWASDEDWDLNRPTITRLYVKENKRLWQIVDYMSKEHRFYATPKMYKTRFKRWGLWKNTQAADVAEILRQTVTSESGATAVAAAATVPTKQQVFLVNGKQVDVRRVERYIRNRCRQYGLRPTELSASLLNNSASGSTPLSRPGPFGLSEPTGLLTGESACRMIQTYFDGSLASGRWVFASEADCDLATEGGTRVATIVAQFHERFKTVSKLLAEPGTPKAAEGIRMARICFAELPSVLDNSLGPEDPMLVLLVLIILQHIRQHGEKLRWMQVQLIRYIADLAHSLPAARPNMSIWAAIRDMVLQRTLTDHASLQMTKVAIDVCRQYLGSNHAKTLELITCGYINFDDNIAMQEVMYLEMLKELDALGTFDERHVGVRMNLATFYNMYQMPDKAAEVGLVVVENPWMLEQSKRYRGLTYKFYWELGNSRHNQGRLDEAEAYFRDALDIAKWELRENKGNKANFLEGVVSLEVCLREMGKDAEAEDALAERDQWIKEGLESVGEVE